MYKTRLYSINSSSMFRSSVVALHNNGRRILCPRAFSKANGTHKYDQKNVVYIGYIGVYQNKHVFKYGKSSNIYQREATHKKTFEHFELVYVHVTDMKDQVEQVFEKELMSQDLHTTLVIAEKKQTELFHLDSKDEIEKINELLCTIIEDSDRTRSDSLKLQLASISLRKLEIKYQTKLLEYKLKLLEHNMYDNNK